MVYKFVHYEYEGGNVYHDNYDYLLLAFTFLSGSMAAFNLGSNLVAMYTDASLAQEFYERL